MEKGEQGQAALRRSMGWRAPEDRLTPARSIVAVELSIVYVVCVFRQRNRSSRDYCVCEVSWIQGLVQS